MDLTSSAGAFRWDDIDKTIVAPKLSKLSEEMRLALIKDESQISFEATRRGNSAYFLPTFLENQIQRMDEMARRQYEIYCEGWYEQGRCITPEFIRAVYKNVIVILIQVSKASMADHLTRAAHRTKEPLNQHCLNQFNSSMDRLANTWRMNLEAEAKVLEQNSYAIPHSSDMPMSMQQIHEAILTLEARLTEVNSAIEAQRQALALASANGGPASKIRQEMRRLSVAKVTLDQRLKECEQLRTQQEKASIETEPTKISKQKRAPRAKPPCFEAAITLLTKEPKLSLVEFCRKMDAKAEQFKSATKYRPPENWGVRSFYDQYRKRRNTVSSFVSRVRREMRSAKN